MTEVVVGRRGEARIRRGHPWVFRSDVSDTCGAQAGTVVRILGHGRHTLGHALFSSRSEIMLRVIARGEDLASDWLERRLDLALAFRASLGIQGSACRLVHAEGDGLPSLVVDRYGEYLVVQTLSQGMEALQAAVVRHLVERLAPRGVLARNDPKVRALEGLPQEVSALYGEVPDSVEVEEHGVRLAADLWKGQKTGLFLDQRENHVMARGYGRGRVLDAFAYNGGFALNVAPAAQEVLTVDVSADAVLRTQSNARLNGCTNLSAREANAFDLLRQLEQEGQRFDTVILDPPAFAKSKAAVEAAWRGYKEINLRALKLLARGGYLITCSCSYHVHETDFEEILTSAAADAGVAATVVEKRRQARDHPVVLGVPETCYLKCLVLRRLD
jgi:23S rRNA (cytosine1962-C5)-methyltransferase